MYKMMICALVVVSCANPKVAVVFVTDVGQVNKVSRRWSDVIHRTQNPGIYCLESCEWVLWDQLFHFRTTAGGSHLALAGVSPENVCRYWLVRRFRIM